MPGPVLKNRGIPVSVHRLVVDENGDFKRPLERTLDSADEPVFDERYVRLTNLVLSDIEEHFGDLDQWQQKLAENPFRATVDTLALVWDLDRRVTGQMMVDGTLDDYSTALGASFMMANGSSAEDVGKVLAQGIKAAKEVRAEMTKAVEQLVAEAEKAEAEQAKAEQAEAETATTTSLPATPGIPTFEVGSELVGASPSSGP